MRIKKAFEKESFYDIKNNGYDAVIIKDVDDIQKLSKDALESGIKLWVKVTNTQLSEIEVIKDSTGAEASSQGFAKYVSCDTLLKILEAQGKYKKAIAGFFVQLPDFFWDYIWNDSLKELFIGKFGSEDAALDELFNNTKDEKNRELYFNKAERYVYKTYIKPLVSFGKRNKITVCFDLGASEIENDLILRFINIFRFKKEGIPVLVRENPFKTFWNGAALNKEPHLVEYPMYIEDTDISRLKETKAPIILIAPTAGIKRLTKKRKRAKIYLDIPEVEAGVEANYLSDILRSLGYCCVICSEEYFKNNVSLKEGSVLIDGLKASGVVTCSKCVFTKKGKDLIKALENNGIPINDKRIFDEIKRKDAH